MRRMVTRHSENVILPQRIDRVENTRLREAGERVRVRAEALRDGVEIVVGNVDVSRQIQDCYLC